MRGGKKGKSQRGDNVNKRKIENNIAITIKCINNYKKRNITAFGINSYECRSLNCNEKRGRKENRRGSDLWFKMESQGRGGTIIYHQYDKRQN